MRRPYSMFVALACAVRVGALAAAGRRAPPRRPPTASRTASHPCLLPFPDNRLTRADHTSATGRRLSLPVRGDAAEHRRRRASAPASTTASTASAPAAR